MKKIPKKTIELYPELEFFNFCKRIHVSREFMIFWIIKDIKESKYGKARYFVRKLKKKNLSKIDIEILYINFWFKFWKLFPKNLKISCIKGYQIDYKKYQLKYKIGG